MLLFRRFLFFLGGGGGGGGGEGQIREEQVGMWHRHEFSFTVISGTLIKINFSAWFDYDTTSVFALSFPVFTFFSCIYFFDCYHLECWCQHASLFHTDSYSLAKHALYLYFIFLWKCLLMFLYSDIFNLLNKRKQQLAFFYRQKKKRICNKNKRM